MFERFTERARQVIVLSQEAARAWDDAEIDTHHLLVGLVREEEGLACKLLKARGVDEGKILHIIPTSGEVAPASGQIPFTQRAKETIERCLREALSLGNNYIGTEHILLAIAYRDEGKVLLDALGVNIDEIRGAIIRELSPTPAPKAKPQPSTIEGIAVKGEQVARLFRQMNCTGAQAGKTGVVWYFDGGINLNFDDGGSFYVTVQAPRS